MSFNTCTLSKHGMENSAHSKAPYDLHEMCNSTLQQPLVMGLWTEMQNTFESITFEASIEGNGSWYYIAREGNKFIIKVSKDNHRDAQYGVICSLFVLAVDYLKMKWVTGTSRLNDYAEPGALALATLFYDEHHIAGYKRTFVERVAMHFTKQDVTQDQIISAMVQFQAISDLLTTIKNNCKGEKVVFAIGDVPAPKIELELESRKCKTISLYFPQQEKCDVKEFAQLVLKKLIAWSLLEYTEDCDQSAFTPSTALNSIQLMMKCRDVQDELKKELATPSRLLYLLLDE